MILSVQSADSVKTHTHTHTYTAYLFFFFFINSFAIEAIEQGRVEFSAENQVLVEYLLEIQIFCICGRI